MPYYKTSQRWRLVVEHNRRRILKAYARLMGCSRCGAKEGDLHFDHVDPETKSFNVMQGGRLSMKAEKILGEVDKCQILCRDCHETKSRPRRDVIYEDGWAVGVDDWRINDPSVNLNRERREV